MGMSIAFLVTNSRHNLTSDILVAFIIYLAPLLQCSLSLAYRSCVADISVLAGNPLINFSLNSDQLWSSVWFSVSPKRNFFAVKGELYLTQQDKNWKYRWRLYQFEKVAVLWQPLGSMTLSAMDRQLARLTIPGLIFLFLSELYVQLDSFLFIFRCFTISEWLFTLSLMILFIISDVGNSFCAKI